MGYQQKPNYNTWFCG